MEITDRGNRRFAINVVRASEDSKDGVLDMLSDIESWFRKAYPHYRSSWSVKMKAQSIREYIKAVYVLTEEFFADCQDQNIAIPRSAANHKSKVELAIEKHRFLPD